MPAAAAVANNKFESPRSATPPPQPIVKVDIPSPQTPSKPLKVYEDPFTEEDQTTPKPTFTGPVLEDKPVNEAAGTLSRQESETDSAAANTGSAGADPVFSPEKVKQNSRLLDSGIAKVKSKTLDVHGFRKLQGIIRDNKAALFTDEKFDALLMGLFGFLESPLSQLTAEKAQDVKAQVLATIKLLLKKMRDSFQPHVTRGLESMLRSRANYDGRTHMVSGLELLADELVTLGDASKITLVLSRMLSGNGNGNGGTGGNNPDADNNTPGGRSLSMGLHVLKEMVDAKPAFVPSDAELANLAGLALRCLDSAESGVRMDAVQLCVALHARVGEQRFWEAMMGVKDDPKNLITYYIVKRQREKPAPVAAAATVAV